MTTAVRLETIEPLLIAAVHRQTTFPQVPRVLLSGLDVVWAFIRSKQLQHGHNVALYRKLGGQAVELTCGVQVAARFSDEGEIVCTKTPSGDWATSTHVGPYDRMGVTYDTIGTWAAQSGYRLAGTNLEVYGDWHNDPAQLETKLHMLIEPI
jgi:effector-binding domain-containing protein